MICGFRSCGPIILDPIAFGSIISGVVGAGAIVPCVIMFSINQSKTAGLESVLPNLSIALTWKV